MVALFVCFHYGVGYVNFCCPKVRFSGDILQRFFSHKGHIRIGKCDKDICIMNLKL
jgi:hypothetical protein